MALALAGTCFPLKSPASLCGGIAFPAPCVSASSATAGGAGFGNPRMMTGWAVVARPGCAAGNVSCGEQLGASGIDLSVVSDKNLKLVVAAAVAVPAAMAGMAILAAFLMRRRMRKEALRDVEEYTRLMAEGMDEESARNMVLSKIEATGPDLRRRKRRQVEELQQQQPASNQHMEERQQEQPNRPIIPVQEEN